MRTRPRSCAVRLWLGHRALTIAEQIPWWHNDLVAPAGKMGHRVLARVRCGIPNIGRVIACPIPELHTSATDLYSIVTILLR